MDEYISRINSLPLAELYKMSSIGFEFDVEDGAVTEVVNNG